MTEYIILGAVVLALTIACIITAKTAKKVSMLLAKATKEVVEIVGDIRQANVELRELRKELHLDHKRKTRKPEDRRHDERRSCDRRKEDRRESENNSDRQDPK